MLTFRALRHALLPAALLACSAAAGAQDLNSLKQQLDSTDLNSLKQHISTQDLENIRQKINGTDLNTFKKQLSPQDLSQLQQQLGSTDLNSLKQRLNSQDLGKLKQQMDGTDLNSLRQQVGSGKLGGLEALGGGSTAALLGKIATPATTGNAAGLLGYCIKNNYLGGASGAAGLKDRLLSKLGGESQASRNDASYQQGLQGILNGGDGHSFNLGQQSGELKQKLTDKACKAVLKQGRSLL